MILYWRVAAAMSLSSLLVGSHWKFYRMGENAVQFRWNEERIVLEKKALEASESNRKKENDLRLSTERIRNDYAKEKARRIADAVIADGKLRDLTAAINSAAAANPATSPGVDDDPRFNIIAECSGELVTLDKAVKGLASQTSALQDFTRSVRVK